jgi:hypothetical protein
MGLVLLGSACIRLAPNEAVMALVIAHVSRKWPFKQVAELLD